MPSYWTPIHSLSDARSEPLPTNKRKRTSDIPPIQAPLPSSAASTSATLAQTVPQRTSDKGVYRIGDRYLLSVDAPVVHALIAYMNEHWALPATPNLNKNVVVLAALQVAIHPTQAAHWVFWNDKERQRTQEMCKKHCGELSVRVMLTPCLILKCSGTTSSYPLHWNICLGRGLHYALSYPRMAHAHRVEAVVLSPRTETLSSATWPNNAKKKSRCCYRIPCYCNVFQ